VSLTAAQVRDYYHGFANRTLWPLLHNAIEKPVFERSWWAAYGDVNRRFADAATTALDASPDALLWVHDYHLLLVPELVRERRSDQRTGFFLHTPWPSPDIFARIPWRKELLRGLLGADVVSFHTDGYRRNFVAPAAGCWPRTARGCAATSCTCATAGSSAPRRRPSRSTSTSSASWRRRRRPTPRWSSCASSSTGAPCCSASTGSTTPRASSSGCRRSRRCSSGGPTCASSVVLVQVAVPSRDDVKEYRALRGQVEQLAGRINGRFTSPGGDVPVHYLYRSLPPSRSPRTTPSPTSCSSRRSSTA
jgi:trehalose 6-phosphate synthase